MIRRGLGISWVRRPSRNNARTMGPNIIRVRCRSEMGPGAADGIPADVTGSATARTPSGRPVSGGPIETACRSAVSLTGCWASASFSGVASEAGESASGISALPSWGSGTGSSIVWAAGGVTPGTSSSSLSGDRSSTASASGCASLVLGCGGVSSGWSLRVFVLGAMVGVSGAGVSTVGRMVFLVEPGTSLEP